jgi:hypothetical protein
LVQGVITCDLLDCTGQAWNGPAAQAVSTGRGVFKSWGYSGSHALELLEKSSYVPWDWLF